MPSASLTVQPIGDFRLVIKHGAFNGAELACSAVSYDLAINKIQAISMKVGTGTSILNSSKTGVARELVEALQLGKAGEKGSLVECEVHEILFDKTICIFKGYICSCALAYRTGYGSSSADYKIDCLGYGAKLMVQPVSGYIETTVGNVLKRMHNEVLNINFDTAQKSGDLYAEQQMPLLLSGSTVGTPVRDRVAVCIAAARECSSFKELKEKMEKLGKDPDVLKTFGGKTNLKVKNTGPECDERFSIDLFKNLIGAMESADVFTAITNVLTSTDFSLELYPRWNCDEKEDFRIDIGPVTAWKPRKVIKLDSKDVVSVSSAFNSTEDMNTPDIVFVNFNDVLAYSRGTTENSLASVYGVSSFDKKLRASLQARDYDKTLNQLLDPNKIFKVREFTAPPWCAMLATNGEAVIENRKKSGRVRQPEKLKDKNTSVQDTLTVNQSKDGKTAFALADKLATSLMYYMYKAEHTAVVELLPSLRFGLQDGKFLEDSIGDTITLKLDNSSIMESDLTMKGVLRSIHFDYKVGDSSSVRYLIILERVRVIEGEDTEEEMDEESPIYTRGN